MGERYANVIVDISHERVDRPFQYRIQTTGEAETGRSRDGPLRSEKPLEKGLCGGGDGPAGI